MSAFTRDKRDGFPPAITALLLLGLAAFAAAAQQGDEIAKKILEGARREAKKGTPYIMDYEVMQYPGGDVSEGTGVCTDLVVRALRNAGLDLQKELHEDRAAHPDAYPTGLWEHKKADKNIDHRRCPNTGVWFRRHTREVSASLDPKDLPNWKAGDVVFFVTKGEKHPWHTAIISDKHDADGMPMIIDAFPPKTSETHRLDAFAPIHSHFRVESLPAPRDSKRPRPVVDSPARR